MYGLVILRKIGFEPTLDQFQVDCVTITLRSNSQVTTFVHKILDFTRILYNRLFVNKKINPYYNLKLRIPVL